MAKAGVKEQQEKGEEFEREIFKTQKIIATLEEKLDQARGTILTRKMDFWQKIWIFGPHLYC